MTKQDKADITYERVAAVLQQLRDSGGRATTASWSLIEALVAAEDRRQSLTAEELADAVHRSHPLVNDSTIYRILDRLEKADLVEHVHLAMAEPSTT